ncbi:16S rRNA (guanine527-N7)-methyltransferase [Tepidamorphus gemmatus]|uniref:Ribosomal RNA small subunit methyltransferase G n=2 Tax=Tepidamorphus gemmatus TaxID=747076 RepID=A0A4R3MFF5_9HYPH|nr:16S rRNA (guanine527-N7)-methyltransferase [Tepidamorphus gemmatus]
MMADRAGGLALLESITDVSRETRDRLDRYADLLRRWSSAKNLVGPDTLSRLWTRHIADSAQAQACLPAARRWADLGSGAGLPGLIIAILLADRPGACVDLVESNGRKCAFLRAAQRATGAAAQIQCRRIEDYVVTAPADIEAVSARALAPLDRLLTLAFPLLARGAVGVFHKGQDVERELTRASICWKFTHELIPSRTQPGAAIVIVRNCVARDRQSGDGSHCPEAGI